ncbi:DedA family protein [Mycobacterium kubicae]|uniref:DedA family protein n=1 Tax=Mycobacterium kubicae TaxID=120959 RepID=UPI0007FF534E|nr:DedA family protein [Mycobacterium kubicae]OBF24362.1 alkaline phosphatase [Mycobacterium kubicae]OBK51759.1 alkaline phosphatase [Mycobacterium kubicae]QNI05506.1 DedA family protein [Mycobacterium kubicae]
MSAQLPGVLQSLAPVLNRHGYAAIVVLVGMEGFGIPLPGQTVLVAAGIFAGAGQLNLAAVLAVGFLAAVGGDNIGYAIGRFGGRRLVLRFGRYVFLTENRVAAAERFFARRGNIFVSIARFVDGLRQANGFVAAMARMSWWRFLAYNALGGASWVAVWVSLGYLAGNHIGEIYETFKRYQIYVCAALVVGVLVLVVRWLRRRRSRKQAAEPATAESPAG